MIEEDKIARPSSPLRSISLAQAGWLAAAAVLGFLVSAIFAGLLRLPRQWFLVPYVGLSTAFIALYLRSTGVDLARAAGEHLLRGIVAAVVVGVFLVQNVRGQLGGGRAEGTELVFQLVWFGLVYGAVDGLLLSVVPVLATEHLAGGRDRPGTPFAWAAVGAAALVASMAVAAAYHLGYPEFQNAGLLRPVIGNAVITSSYLVSRNPLSPVLAHVIMHVAAVLHGPGSTVQLPPHY